MTAAALSMSRLVEQARRGALEDRQIGAQILQLRAGRRAVGLLPDEDQVEHANDAAVDQVEEERQAFAGRAAVRELDHQCSRSGPCPRRTRCRCSSSLHIPPELPGHGPTIGPSRASRITRCG